MATLIKWKYILHVNILSFVKPREARTNISLTSQCPTVFTIYYFYIIYGCSEERILHENIRGMNSECQWMMTACKGNPF